MPVKIFVPKVPSNQDEFNSFIKKICNSVNIRISKNKDGSNYCIIALNSNDDEMCANHIINEMNGKMIGDVVLKPRLYVDQSLLSKLSHTRAFVREKPDDIVNTTHYSNGFYYIQLFSEKNTNLMLTSLLNDLLEDFKTRNINPLTYEDIQVEKLYATFYSNESVLYRIKILEKLNNRIRVYYIDYGNEEIIKSENIIPIHGSLAQFAPMAHKCVITGVEIINRNRENVVAREVLQRNFEAKLLKENHRVISLDYLDFSTITYRQYLIIEDIAREYQPSDAIPASSHNGFKEEESLVVMTHFESLDEFYTQSVNELVDNAMSALNTSINKFVVENNESGYRGQEHMYISKFSQDGIWYRCRVIDDQFASSSPHCIVQYIDFGNTEIKMKKEDLIPINLSSETELMINLPGYAKRCRFSEDLIYALSKAKMEKDYFMQNFVIPEKTIRLSYHCERLNKDLKIVENIKLNEGEDIMSIVLQQCEKTKKIDIYRLSNLEYFDKIWFVMVKSIDPVVQNELHVIDRWTKDQKIKDLQIAKEININTIYCAKHNGGNLVRCRVMGKNKNAIMIQELDTGLYDMVSIESIYNLPESVRSIRPMAKSLKLVLDSIGVEEHQIAEKITQILGNHNVELVMTDEETIRDVLIKEKSLVQCLEQLDYIQRKSITANDIECINNKSEPVLDCLKFGVDSEPTCVDFSLPSVEKMDEVPKEIMVLNAKRRFLRNLVNVNKGNILEELVRVVKSCEKMTVHVDCCAEVDQMSQCVESLKSEFVASTCRMKTKMRDLDPLIEKRTKLCENICSLYSRLDLARQDVTSHHLELLESDISTITICINNLMEIFQISPTDPFSVCDIDTVLTQIGLFRVSALFLNIANKLQHLSCLTDECESKCQRIYHDMHKDYKLGDVLPSSNVAVPLIDHSYEFHGALKSECEQIIDLLTKEDITEQFDVRQIIQNFNIFLQQQRVALEIIITKSNELVSLNEYALSILADDSQIFLKIEENQKKIIMHRSTLKHNIADMEDAEEQDDRETINEIRDKITQTRSSLHDALIASQNIIDDEVRKLMIRKPELQLKNQSIFYCDEGIPVFMWDSIFFDIPHTESFVDFFSTNFANDVVIMKKLLLQTENYKTVLHNLTTYSSRTISGSDSSIVSLLPISTTFLSKSEVTTVYMILPDFVAIHQLHDSYIDKPVKIFEFFKSAIHQLLNLWHIGYTYSESDLENGLFVTSPDHSKVYLPLPLNSILKRESISDQCESLQVYVSKLGHLLEESLNMCSVEQINVSDAKIQQLFDAMQRCKGVLDAEHVFEDFDRFVMKFSPKESKSDKINGLDQQIYDLDEDEVSNDNASSIEQLHYDEDVGTDESHRDEFHIKEAPLNESVLENSEVI